MFRLVRTRKIKDMEQIIKNMEVEIKKLRRTNEELADTVLGMSIGKTCTGNYCSSCKNSVQEFFYMCDGKKEVSACKFMVPCERFERKE